MLQEDTNVRIELMLQHQQGKESSIRGDVSMEIRADISTREFWCSG